MKLDLTIVPELFSYGMKLSTEVGNVWMPTLYYFSEVIMRNYLGK